MSVFEKTFTLDESLLILGARRSHDVLAIKIDLAEWTDALGADGTISVSAIRSGDTVPYVVSNITFADSILTWLVSEADTGFEGFGRFIIDYTTAESGLHRSKVYKTYTSPSLDGASSEPSDFDSWYDKMLDVLADAEEAQSKAEQAQSNAEQSAIRAEEIADSITLMATDDGNGNITLTV